MWLSEESFPFFFVEGKHIRVEATRENYLCNNSSACNLLLSEDYGATANMHLNSLFAKRKTLLAPSCFQNTNQVHQLVRDRQPSCPSKPSAAPTWLSLGLLWPPGRYSTHCQPWHQDPARLTDVLSIRTWICAMCCLRCSLSHSRQVPRPQRGDSGVPSAWLPDL